MSIASRRAFSAARMSLVLVLTTFVSWTARLAAAATTDVKINEVESNGGTPDDWVELYNSGSGPVDISGLIFRDNDNTHTYAIPAGATISAGGFYVLDTNTASTPAGFNFGLGSADSAWLFGSDGTTLIDSFTWTAHATTT